MPTPICVGATTMVIIHDAGLRPMRLPSRRPLRGRSSQKPVAAQADCLGGAALLDSLGPPRDSRPVMEPAAVTGYPMGRFGLVRRVALAGAVFEDHRRRASNRPLSFRFQTLPRPPLGFAAIPIRHIDQTGDPADQRILVAGQGTIRICHLPEHLDDADAFLLGEVIDHYLGEMKKIGRLDCTCFRDLDEMGRLAVVQTEAPYQRALNDALLPILDAVIAARHLDEQHREGKRGIVSFAGSMGIIVPGQDVEQCVEQCPSERWLTVPLYQLVPARR
jgi:hypothetical protein